VLREADVTKFADIHADIWKHDREILDGIDEGGDVGEWDGMLEVPLEVLAPSTNGHDHQGQLADDVDADLRDLLDAPAPAYAWKIPDLIEALDRVYLTGGEGDGKTTLLRQIAIQATAAIRFASAYLESESPRARPDEGATRRRRRRDLRRSRAAVARAPGRCRAQPARLPGTGTRRKRPVVQGRRP
jgi:hypothetical protein